MQVQEVYINLSSIDDDDFVKRHIKAKAAWPSVHLDSDAHKIKKRYKRRKTMEHYQLTYTNFFNYFDKQHDYLGKVKLSIKHITYQNFKSIL